MKIKAITTKRSFEVQIPASKSFMNRALVVASLANGESYFHNPIYCDDTNYMIKALKLLGIKIKKDNERLIVYGLGGYLKIPKSDIFVGNAGTAFRFLTSLVVLCKGNVVIDGDERMRMRPIKDLLIALESLGVETNSNKGFPPITINGLNFSGGKVDINANISSQFVSSLMMIAPFAEKQMVINLKGKVTSKPYIDITTKVMQDFGASIKNIDYKKIIISNSKKYFPQNYYVESDASNASYFMAAAAITESAVKIYGLNLNSIQGDIKFINILKKMGCKVNIGTNYIEVIGSKLKGIDVDMNEMPDLVPTLAVIAIFAKGNTVIRNVENLRYKECDRLNALYKELTKIGASVKELKSGLIIKPNELRPALISTYNDHRMAMSFSIAGLRIDGLEIENPQCVKKSFPDYWKVFKKTFYS